MSKIECCEGVRGNTLFLRGILQNKIDIICEKIGFSDLGVLWTIYDPISLYKSSIQHAVLIGKNGRDYGFSCPILHQIWISTKAILCNNDVFANEVSNALKRRRDDFLAEVILDEITHIQTGEDHGNLRYDLALERNQRRYYNSH